MLSFILGMTEKEVKKFYNSKHWKNKRLIILARDRSECQDCKKRLEDAVKNNAYLTPDDRRIRPAQEVHHIKELKEFPELGLEEDNLVSLCTICHNARHGRTVKYFNVKKERLTEEQW